MLAEVPVGTKLAQLLLEHKGKKVGLGNGQFTMRSVQSVSTYVAKGSFFGKKKVAKGLRAARSRAHYKSILSLAAVKSNCTCCSIFK